MEALAEQENTEITWHQIEAATKFSQSMIWDLQRNYFAKRGVEAWRHGEVPHYVTSNPRVACAYAEVVFGCLRDRARLGQDTQPLYLCELGAGSGRFAFHFLTHLTALCARGGLRPDAFCYVMTDIAQNNLEFWRYHCWFRPFFAQGTLDIALFDATRTEHLALQMRRKTIVAGELDQPLVVIANYLFDTIPQELFYIDGGRCHDCLVSLFVDQPPEDLDAGDILAQLQCHYEYQELSEPPFEDAGLRALLASYLNIFERSHVLFPTAGLDCLRRLKAISRQGLLLLSADKGDHRLDALQGQGVPGLVKHGSFSLNVNYHALAGYCEQNGGMALFPQYRHQSVNIACLMMMDGAEQYEETRDAYARHVQVFGPDDFYSISKHARQFIDTMTVEDILAYTRLSYHDAHQFARYLPRLTALATELSGAERDEVRLTVDRVWAFYYPLGEDLDLAQHIACLLYAIGEYEGAIKYFQRSIQIYGPNKRVRENIATCRQQLTPQALVA